MPVEEIITTFLSEILIVVVLSLSGLVYSYRNKILELQQKIINLENKLYGFDNDDSNKGFVKRTDERLEQQSERVDHIDEEVQEIKHTVIRIDEKLDDNRKD